MMSAGIIGAIATVAIVIAFMSIYRHQCRLRERAFLMREAIRNRDFTFHLPTRGLLFGERALQETLNDLGQRSINWSLKTRWNHGSD